jgi:hypothetical protein
MASSCGPTVGAGLQASGSGRMSVARGPDERNAAAETSVGASARKTQIVFRNMMAVNHKRCEARSALRNARR